MPVVTVDFETYYSDEYSLTRMSETAYILDGRFETIMCALKVDDQPTRVLVGRDNISAALSQIDWDRAALLAHRTLFDGAILAWHFGHIPTLYLDTESMARATTHWVLSHSSLAKLSDYFGLPAKGDEVVRAKGMRLRDFTLEELKAYALYCRRDNESCHAIFQRMRPIFSSTELSLIDMILRMFIQPQVKLNPTKLAEHLEGVKAEKAEFLASVPGVDKLHLSSNGRFAELLQICGVDPPRKISPTTGKETWALAKNDRAFREMCQDDTLPPHVQALLGARLSVKSTLEETRTQRLLDTSELTWPWQSPPAGSATEDAGRWFPIPLRYYGARPGRLSGDGKINAQNITRGSPIRDAIEAPLGYRIIHRDASQIEARIVAWMAGCRPLLEAFEMGVDVYCAFATSVYGRHITKNDISERFVGKTGILGLGYGCGPDRFRHMLFLGSGGVSLSVSVTEARRIVYHYRGAYPEIPQLWDGFEMLLRSLCERNGRKPPSPGRSRNALSALDRIPIKPGFDSLWLPNGLCISYPRLRHERNPNGDYEYIYDDVRNTISKLYGAKVCENVSQALARIVVTDAAVRLRHITGHHPFLTTHDSLDYCVPEKDAADMDAELSREFAVRPSWAPDLPLTSDGGWGRTLLEAERKVNQ